ncbi:MAG: hypothetical protein ACOVQX_04230 [Legionella sp.]
MSFEDDFASTAKNITVIDYTGSRWRKEISLDAILKSRITPENFKALFKYIIYINSNNRISHLDQLIKYAIAHPSSELKFPDFLAENWFIDDHGKHYSPLEMTACLINQNELLELLSTYIKEAKIQNPSLSFVSSLIKMLAYHPNMTGFSMLVQCHRAEELSTPVIIKYAGLPITPLMQAIIYNNDRGTIETLLAAGCDPNGLAYPDSNSCCKTTPMHLLIDLEYSQEEKKGIIDAFRQAAETQKKMSPLLFHYNDRNPLMYAANTKNREAVELLLQYPEVLKAINDNAPYSRLSAVGHAILLRENASQTEINDSKAIIQMLLMHGASAYNQDRQQNTALMIGANSDRSLEALNFLIDNLCLTENQPELIKLFNQQNEDGLTILNFLLLIKNKTAAKALLDKIIAYGKENLTLFSSLTKNGRTALDFAEETLDKTSPDCKDLIDLITKHTPPNEEQQKLRHLKNACHVLGFKSDPNDRTALSIINNRKLNVQAEGFEDKFTFPLLVGVLNHFVEENPGEQEFQAIKEAFEVSQKAYQNTNAIDSDSLFERYNHDKIVIIPAGWSQHSITLALYRNKIIIANRGEGKHSDGGVTVFQLNNDLISQFKQADLAQNKANFSTWIKSISADSSSNDSRIFMNQLAEHIVSPKDSTNVPTLDLTTENSLTVESDYFTEQRIPKKYPLLVQTWENYKLVVEQTLPENNKDRKPNACYLTQDALYQINQQGEAKKIIIKDLDQFKNDLTDKLSVKILSTPYFGVINFLDNRKLHLFKQIIEAQGGTLDHPVRKQEIIYYYQAFHQGNQKDHILEGCNIEYPSGLSFATGTAFINKKLSEEEHNQLQTALLKIHCPPLLSFPSKEQSYQTCSFANKKSIIEAMLYFLNPDSQTASTDNIDAAKKIARKKYKQFTETMRDQFVDRLINDLIEPKQIQVNLLILGKVLAVNAPLKERRILRQSKIINHIHERNREDNNADYQQFTNDYIIPFYNSCIRSMDEKDSDIQQQRLIHLQQISMFLAEQCLFKDKLSKSLLTLNEIQMEQFYQLLQYLRQNNLATEGVIFGLLNLSYAIDDCTKLLNFKNQYSTPKNLQQYGKPYTDSVDQFVNKSIRLITNTDRNMSKLKEQLKTEANHSFKQHNWEFRLFLDILAIVATLGGIIIYNYYQYDRPLLFSQEKTDRQISFETLLPKIGSH